MPALPMDMYDAACPTDEQLLDLCAGRLDEAFAAALDAHIGACAACRTIVQHLGRETAPAITPVRARTASTRRSLPDR